MMDYKLLNDNIKIPIIWLGTWGIGGFKQADTQSDEQSIQTLKTAIDLGYTHIDTAEIYGNGHTEELIGLAIKGFTRSDLTITSKVSKDNLWYNDVIDSCKKSLDRLQTDYIDIYLAHCPNNKIPLEETMQAFDELIEQRLIRFIGLSNFSVEQMMEAQKYSKNKVVVNQIPYNLATRNHDHIGNCDGMELNIIPYCQKNDILIVAYRPIERWFLLQPNELLDALSKKYSKSKIQIVLNRLVSKKNVITIPKSINPDHLKENLGAIWWHLSGSDILLLDKLDFWNL